MPLTEDQIAFENDWAKRWLAGTRSLKPELWVDPFYKGKLLGRAATEARAKPKLTFVIDDAVIVRGNLPSLEGIHAIREGVAEMCQVFSLFDARYVGNVVHVNWLGVKTDASVCSHSSTATRPWSSMKSSRVSSFSATWLWHSGPIQSRKESSLRLQSSSRRLLERTKRR